MDSSGAINPNIPLPRGQTRHWTVAERLETPMIHLGSRAAGYSQPRLIR